MALGKQLPLELFILGSVCSHGGFRVIGKCVIKYSKVSKIHLKLPKYPEHEINKQMKTKTVLVIE